MAIFMTASLSPQPGDLVPATGEISHPPAATSNPVVGHAGARPRRERPLEGVR